MKFSNPVVLDVVSAPQQLPDFGVTGLPNEFPSFPGGEGISWENLQNQTSGGIPGNAGELPTYSGGIPGADGISWENIQNQTSVGMPGPPGELPTFPGGQSWDSLQNQTSGGLPGASGNIPDFSGGMPGQDGGSRFPEIPGTPGDLPDFSNGIPSQEGGFGFPGGDQWDNIRNQTGSRIEVPGGGNIPGGDGFGNLGDLQNQTIPGMNVGTEYFEQLQNQTTMPGNINQGCASGLGGGDNP